MKVVGIIAEYNPLHEGHAYHIKKSVEKTDADATICVLSSNFVQRGEPSIISKQARTRMALKNGIDLVIELPSAFSCASAEYFASASVKLLDSLGIVDTLCFGSEEGTLDSLMEAARFFAYETPEFKSELKSALDMGLSFPAARQKALESCLDQGVCQAVSQPNNILGVEYLKALIRFNSCIKPVTIGRVGQGYNDDVLQRSFSSATAIRRCIKEAFPDGKDPGINVLKDNMPENSIKELEREIYSGRGPVFLENFEEILFYRIRSAANSELMNLPFMEEGLSNRLKNTAKSETTLEGLVKSCTSSRYPASRIKRILCALLLSMTDSFLEELRQNGYVQYIRVLGFNQTGRKLLAKAGKLAGLPIIIKPSSYRRMDNPLAVRLFEHEISATDTYVLGFNEAKQKRGGSELTTSVTIIDN